MAIPTLAWASAGASHGNHAALSLEFFDRFRFLFRQHLGLDPVYVQLVCYGIGSFAAIAREHDHRDAVGMQIMDRLRRRVLYWISNAEEACHPAVNA
jgi:hypothetical protein